MLKFRRQNRIPDLVFILLVFSVLLIIACKQKKADEGINSSNLKESSQQSLLNLLQFNQVDSLVSNYSRDTGEVDQSFLYSNLQTQKTEKVGSFWMGDQERAIFFQTLEQLEAKAESSIIDSVRLKVLMAFQNPIDLSGNIGSTNFTPILQFLVNQDSVISVSYDLEPFEPLVNWSTYECKIDTSKNNSNIQIPCSLAVSLINRWIQVPNDAINEQLYLYPYSNNKTLEDRVRYYVFDSKDTKDIHDHRKSLKANGDSCYFHLHLGIFNKEDEIPLRNVIHLDEKNMKADSVIYSNKSTFFEFSNPCPKLCGGGNVN